MSLDCLTIASCMAPNADATCHGIARHLESRLGLPVRFVDDIPWRAREHLFDSGSIHLCWLCGLPYVWKADALPRSLELVAAPVMAGARYGGRPVYFSDVVVHAQSRYAAFADLRGATWAYNEPNSHSGYNVVRHHLHALRTPGYFGAAVESGAHQASLNMIIERRVDASAIDSTVLEAELARTPALRRHIRVIDALGPSPMPPWVMRSDLPPAVKTAVRDSLLGMADAPDGKAVLDGWGIARLVEVADRDYDPIRDMWRNCEGVKLAA